MNDVPGLHTVRERGLEPLRPKTLEPKSSASANSATRAGEPSIQDPDFGQWGSRWVRGIGARCRGGLLPRRGNGSGDVGKSVDAEFAAQALHVTLGTHVVLGDLHNTFFIQHDRGADDTLDDLAVVLLFTERTPFSHNLLVRV